MMLPRIFPKLLNRTRTIAYFNRGSCPAMANDYIPAIQNFAIAVQLVDPENPKYFRVLGKTKYQLNEMEGNLCENWQKAAELGDEKAALS